MTLIGVKSKYGSCSGNCTGLIKINNKLYIEIYRKSIGGEICSYIVEDFYNVWANNFGSSPNVD